MNSISELPEEVKHRIVYFLPAKDAARTSSLSKQWKLTWDSRPVVDFDEQYFSTDNFAEFLGRSLQRFAGRAISVEVLRLTMTDGLLRPTMHDAIRRWVQFAANKNLIELHIHFEPYRSDFKLDPISSNTLTSLSLRGLSLTTAVNWELPLLRTLSLKNMMRLDSASVDKLVSACPSLESFALRGCEWMRDGLELSHRLGAVKRVEVDSIANIFRLNAPSLETFVYGAARSPHYVPEIVLQGCEASLRELRISGQEIEEPEWLHTQVSKFRGLKVLALELVQCLEPIKISSTELTQLVLIRKQNLAAGSEIYAPNLRALRMNEFPFHYSTLRSLESVNLEFRLMSIVCLEKLKELFDQISHVKNVVVCIQCRHKIVIVHEGLSDSLLRVMCELDDSVLNAQVFITSDSNWEQLVVSPHTAHNIYIASSFDDSDNNNLSEYLSKKLTEIRMDCRYFPYCTRTKRLWSFRMETPNVWSGFVGRYLSNQALLKAYGVSSSFRFTRFALFWSEFIGAGP